jgi:hypothetical protein
MTYSAATLQIINELFGDEDRIPVFDRTAFQPREELWQGIKVDIEEYENTTLQFTTLKRLHELALEMQFLDPFLSEIRKYFNNGKLSFDAPDNSLDAAPTENIFEYLQSEDIDLKSFIAHCYDFFRNNGLSIDVDRIEQRHKSRFSMQKRKIVRNTYIEHEEQETSKSFIEKGHQIDYPLLMLDRVVVFRHSKDHLSYNKEVRDVLKDNSFGFEIDVEGSQYTRRMMSEAGYSDAELDMYCPVNLADQFNLIKNRSILENYVITSKPKKARDGSGWSLLWKTEGITYRFNYQPPKGRPVSLLAHANMQRLVWAAILKDHPEFEEIYNEEFLAEPNFIPLGLEEYYSEYEDLVFKNLVSEINKTYDMMMARLGFSAVDKEKVETRISQVEVCWNLPMPVFVNHFLTRKYS